MVSRWKKCLRQASFSAQNPTTTEDTEWISHGVLCRESELKTGPITYIPIQTRKTRRSSMNVAEDSSPPPRYTVDTSTPPPPPVKFDEPFPSSEERAVVEHVLSLRIQRPVVALARISRLTWDLHEAVVQAQVVTDRVLPSRKFVPETSQLIMSSCRVEYTVRKSILDGKFHFLLATLEGSKRY